jgi:hypothetical protein
MCVVEKQSKDCTLQLTVARFFKHLPAVAFVAFLASVVVSAPHTLIPMFFAIGGQHRKETVYDLVQIMDTVHHGQSSATKHGHSASWTE